jgi:xanthine/CO dehydrogenase XdhC/CoxF family maturation factor
MDILLSRVSAAESWQPLAAMAGGFRAAREEQFAFVVASSDPAYPLGKAFRVNGQASSPPSNVETFIATVSPPPHLLLMGGGPDARPVAMLAAFLGWRITVAEHRAIYLAARHFPPSTALIETRPDNVAAAVQLAEFSAAIVMSHHLESDLHYLRALARTPVPYVGLLGPAARREKLMSDLGADAAALLPRLRAPVGLDIGGRTPESIALAIIGEVHAALAGRAGRPFSETTRSAADLPAGSER